MALTTYRLQWKLFYRRCKAFPGLFLLSCLSPGSFATPSTLYAREWICPYETLGSPHACARERYPMAQEGLTMHPSLYDPAKLYLSSNFSFMKPCLDFWVCLIKVTIVFIYLISAVQWVPGHKQLIMLQFVVYQDFAFTITLHSMPLPQWISPVYHKGIVTSKVRW